MSDRMKSVVLYRCPDFWSGHHGMVVLRDPLEPNRYETVGLTYDRRHLSSAVLRAIRSAERNDGDNVIQELEFIYALCRSVALMTADHLIMRVECRLAIFGINDDPIGLISEIDEDDDECPLPEAPYPDHKVICIGDPVAFYGHRDVRPVVIRS